MGRPLRAAPDNIVSHVLNRANGRLPLSEAEGDYAAFERVVAEACGRISMQVLAYCLMPNHWHLVLWPLRDGDLSRFMGRGKSPGYPDGYVKYENQSGQGVDPYTGRTLPNSKSHFSNK